MENTEIDDRIAIEVMEWEKLNGIWATRSSWHEGKGCQLVHNIDNWQPSTNIAHAFEVVERLRGEPYFYGFKLEVFTKGYFDRFEQQMFFYDEKYIMWNAKFYKLRHNNQDAKADTPSKAICLAALEAVKEGN